MSSSVAPVVRPPFPRMVEGTELAANNDEAVEPSRVGHTHFIHKRPILVKLLLTSGQECIGFCHVDYPDGRVSDIINDDRNFLPLTKVSIAGHHLAYDFLSVNKSLVAMVYEMDRQ
ncbi:hypothetical protein L6R50_09475 [Myxococcota bacterium]|nr:hypothetical protein [Myxococcota bacterium]